MNRSDFVMFHPLLVVMKEKLKICSFSCHPKTLFTEEFTSFGEYVKAFNQTIFQFTIWAYMAILAILAAVMAILAIFGYQTYCRYGHIFEIGSDGRLQIRVQKVQTRLEPLKQFELPLPHKENYIPLPSTR